MILAAPMTAGAASLDQFLAAALEHNHDILLAGQAVDAADAQVTEVRAGALPRVSLHGGYTRNQYAAEAVVPTGPGGETARYVITPKDQLDASLRLDVPIVDGPAWMAARATGACAHAEDALEDATRQQVLLAVVQAYHDAYTAAELEAAAQAAVATAVDLEREARDRAAVGLGTELDVLRAAADTALARQNLANAGVDRIVTGQRLVTLSGLDASADPTPDRVVPSGDADAAVARRADLRALREQVACARARLAGDTWAYAPRLNGFVQERLTNATGFVGQPWQWSAGVSLDWTLFDALGREGAIAGGAAALAQADTRLAQAEQQVRDQVLEASARLTAAEGALTAARARLAASDEALRVARERRDAGAGAAVDLSLAQRERYDAAVGLAVAEGTRAVAVDTLRWSLGEPLAPSGEGP